MFNIVGGHPALDLANTVAPRPPGTVEEEYLPDPAALLDWARRIELIGEAERDAVERAWQAEPGAAESARKDVLALRELVDPVLAGERLDDLRDRWAAAVGRSVLVPVGYGARLVVGAGLWTIGDRLADALVDLLRHADLRRLRACPVAEGGCGWLFLDRSRNGSRRWCSMDDCGTHAKSRRLTERRRERRS